jgi:hypothetical protein
MRPTHVNGETMPTQDSPPHPTQSARSAAAETSIQIALMIAVGAVAAVASWSHVVDLAAEHGQTGWRSYATAAVVETAAVSAGLELRRRRRAEASVSAPVSVLVGAIILQLACQLDAAEPTVWGWLLGAVPLVTFLALADAALSRVPMSAEPAPVPEDEPETPAAPVKRTPTAATGRSSTGARVTRLRDRHPDWTTARIAERVGVSERTVRRYLSATPSQPTDETTERAA